MTIIVDLMLVMVGLYYAGTNDYGNEITEYSSNIENFTAQYEANYDTDTINTETTILERGFGDQKYAGRMWWNIFKTGITPPKACQGLYEENCPAIERHLMDGWGKAFILINLLLLLEIFLVAFNKKTS